jgi:aryl-alcohol dehydrogenase-like predicted oxidoreductase
LDAGSLPQDEKIKKVRELSDLAKRLEVSLSSLAIAWTIKNPNTTTAILGATKKDQLLENLTALDTLNKLTPDNLERIKKILQNKPVLDRACKSEHQVFERGLQFHFGTICSDLQPLQ